jgi:hypothetical protein
MRRKPETTEARISIRLTVDSTHEAVEVFSASKHGQGEEHKR